MTGANDWLVGVGLLAGIFITGTGFWMMFVYERPCLVQNQGILSLLPDPVIIIIGLMILISSIIYIIEDVTND